MPGVDDEELLQLASEEQAVLLTGDKDFGELVCRRGQATGGVALIRMAGCLRAGGLS